MDVKSFVEHVFQEKSNTLGLSISDYQKRQILRTFDLDAVQDYIDEDIRKKQALAMTMFKRHQIANEVEEFHREKLRKITEGWTVYYAKQLRAGRFMLDEDFKEITASMKLRALSCDAYPCQK